MARTKDAVLTPGQKELMEKEYLDFVKPSTYGNKANPSSCNSLYDDVENPELRAIVEKVAATTPYREETSTNEAQSPSNPQKRISGKQRKATLEEYQQTFLQVPRIDDRKTVFVSYILSLGHNQFFICCLCNRRISRFALFYCIGISTSFRKISAY